MRQRRSLQVSIQSCKDCCLRAKTPCLIHVHKIAATSGEKTQPPSTPSSGPESIRGLSWDWTRLSIGERVLSRNGQERNIEEAIADHLKWRRIPDLGTEDMTKEVASLEEDTHAEVLNPLEKRKGSCKQMTEEDDLASSEVGDDDEGEPCWW